MREEMKQQLEQFIANRDCIKKVFKWEMNLLYPACASIYTMRDRVVEEQKLRDCKQLLKSNVGGFSYFRDAAKAPIACMLAISSHPEETLTQALTVYELLKQQVSRSEYLPLAAMLIAEQAAPADYERITIRTGEIYKAMKKEHPFLTSTEDSTFCVLMALSDKSETVLLRDAEICYDILKKEKFSANGVQSLSHVLALSDESSTEKCRRTIELYHKLREAGCKYGTTYQLPTLGALANSETDLDAIVNEMKEIDDWLCRQKGFGFFSSVGHKERLMFAGILAQKEHITSGALETAAINGSIAMVLAQEIALCVAASSAAAASAAASN